MEDDGAIETSFLSCEACSSTPMLTEVIRRGEAHYRVVAECNCGEQTEIPATVFIYSPSSWTLQDGTPVRSVLPEEVQRELRGKDFGPEAVVESESVSEVVVRRLPRG